MFRKFIILSMALLSLSIFIVGCSNSPIHPTSLSLEESIKEIIISKGVGYDFLDDEGYMNHMAKLGEELASSNSTSPHYSIGNLDEDTIPELVVFQEREPDNMDDEGSLELYQFNGEEYIVLDKVSMNFDNTNHQIEIGRIGENQNGMFLCNQVGAHSGVTYGFILEDGKLKSILSNHKLPLISVYPNNEIKDIDGDGILNFSIFAVDPETEDPSMADSDKMTLWYKWNGKDSAELVMVERESYENEKSHKDLFDQAEELININFPESLGFINDNKDNLSKFDNADLLLKYIEKLDELSYDESIQTSSLFEQFQKDNNFDFLFDKYGLTMERLNSFEYLKREKVLKDEEGLKENIIKNIGLGYKLATSEGMYYYLNDYQLLLNLFTDNITNEFRDYLSILALNTNKPFMNDGSLIISMDELSERILLVESFHMIYPYSNFLDEINDIYEQYIYTYFYGDNHEPNFNPDTFLIKEEFLSEYRETIEKYEYTTFAGIVKDFVEWLEENKGFINESIRKKLDDRLK